MTITTKPLILAREKARLAAYTRAIRLGQKAQDDRAAMMISLRERGISLDAIASAAGINREQVRKSIMRRTTGYPGDAAPTQES